MWLVQVPYETLDGDAKVMQSLPLEREDAEALRDHFDRHGHRTNLIDEFNAEDHAPTALQATTPGGKVIGLPIDPREFYAALARRGVCDLAFCGEDLGGYSFFGLELKATDFTDCLLRLAEFTGCALIDAKLRRVQAPHANFDNATLLKVHGDAGLYTRASFRCAEFERSTFETARARGAEFDGADLHETGFDGADLRETSWGGATLRGVSFVGADLSEADFSGAKFEGTVALDGVRLCEATGLPPHLALYAQIREAEPLLHGARRIAPEDVRERRVPRPHMKSDISVIEIAVHKLWLDHALTGGSLLLQPPRKVADAAIAIAMAIHTDDLDEICRMLGEHTPDGPRRAEP